MYVITDGQLKSIKQIGRTPDSLTILIHNEKETEIGEVYKCFSYLPTQYHLRKLFSSDIYIPSDLFGKQGPSYLYHTHSALH